MDEKIFSKLYAAIFIMILGSIAFGMFLGYSLRGIYGDKKIQKEYVCVDTLDWDKFIYSVAYVESNNTANAVGQKNSVGLLQITPTMIYEVNRIVGANKYKLNDRLDSLKSIEIFNIVQDYYNREKSPHKALKIWNSKAPLKYHNDIMNKYNEIK